MPHVEPFDDDMHDESSLHSAAHAQPVPLVDPDDDPRATLARILQRLIDAFGADAGAQVDHLLATLALALTRFVHEPYAFRAVIVGPAGAGKTRLLNLIASIVRAPAVVIPVTDLSETGWRGAQVAEACRLLHPSLFVRDDLARRVTVPASTVALPSIVMLDEIDKLAQFAGGLRLDGASAAARIGKQQSLLPLLDPESHLVVQYEDAPTAFRWSLRNSVVLCSGAFSMAPANRPLTPADLVSYGLSVELVDRMGVVMVLPTPSATTRAGIARTTLQDVVRFAARLGVAVTGIEAYTGTLAAPGETSDYVGTRGLKHFVTQHLLSALADALTQQRSEIDLAELRGEV